ncbi:hypothetical protein PIB30_084222 [Stylosanthes scabra]|uniref:Uncharacterized protein n=1 Tax=Stylosanthes scabra TaxID=79078 RepID=A0ABU6VUI2_9FABA|nr:hypothetical protein [Stylosanthes scabra]
MEIDEMKDKMECMVGLQSRMETMLKTMGDMLNIHLGAHRAQITTTDTTSDTAAMNIPTAQGGIPIGEMVNGLNLNEFTMPIGEGYQPVDRVHTEVPAQVINNATGSHTESGKDKVKEEWMEKIQEQIRSIQGTNTYGRVEIEQLCSMPKGGDLKRHKYNPLLLCRKHVHTSWEHWDPHILEPW